MYPHPRSAASSHSINPPLSHYTHHSPPAFHSTRLPPASSHLHVLQNPPQSAGGSSGGGFVHHQSGSAPSPSRNQQYQPYYPTPASVGVNQDVWANNGALPNNNESATVGGGGGISSSHHHHPRPRNSGTGGLGTSFRTSHRTADHGSTAKSNSSSSDSRPNWGLINRQLSQIAGDVSTSVRQNELVITLLERLIERVDAGNMQNSAAMRASLPMQEERTTSRLPPRRQPISGGYEATVSHDAGRNREESHHVRQSSSTMMGSHHAQADHGNTTAAGAAGPAHISTSHSVPSYLDNDLSSSSFDFSGTSQTIPHRTQYPPAMTHRLDTEVLPKRTPPTVSFMLSGDVAPPLPAASSHTTTYPSATNARHPNSSAQQMHQNNDNLGSSNVTMEESYNRLPSPVFSESAPADHEPPAALGLTQYYDEDGGRDPVATNPLHNHGMHIPPAPQPMARQDSRNRLNVMQTGGMGSLEDAGLIPLSSTSSTSVTPALRSRQAVEVEGAGAGDQSMNTSVAFTNGDDEASGEESANADWKLWLTPKPPEQPLAVPSKYRSIKQVKNERKEKTKRSISTIGRIPLKEYLEVGSDYKLVRRMARTVYNTWLSLNVRLAKQDPDRLMACYHKLEYEFPILGDCEDHWKAKELMLQVIDNAIDEIAFHRRKEERKAQDPETNIGNATSNDTTTTTTTTNNNNNINTSTHADGGLRRDAQAADLYTNEEPRPTRRRRANARDKSGEQTEANGAHRQTHPNDSHNGDDVDSEFTQSTWDPSSHGPTLYTPSEPPPQPAPRARRTQQQMTAGWH